MKLPKVGAGVKRISNSTKESFGVAPSGWGSWLCKKGCNAAEWAAKKACNVLGPDAEATCKAVATEAGDWCRSKC